MKRVAACGSIFLLALALRAIEYSRVFTELGVLPPNGADEYYHLRRIWYSVLHFPAVLERDSYMGFPLGSDVIWPPGFDLAVAGLARMLVGAEDQAGVEALAAWVPAVLGALAALCAVAIATRVFSPGAGLAAGLALALLPGHYAYSRLGMVDHHCAASLVAALLVLGAVRVVQLPIRERWLGHAALLGLGASASLYIWPGALMHVALLQALASLWMLQSGERETAIARARHLALAQGLAALALAPYALGRESEQFGSWSPLVLSSFQPLWLAMNSLACLALSSLWVAAPSLAERASRRWASALALATAALVFVFLALPELARPLDRAAGWFRRDEQELLGIVEMLPLFSELRGGGGGDAAWWGQRAERSMTRLIFVFPALLLWLAAVAARTKRAELWLIAAWGGVAFAQAGAQARFINGLSVPYVIVLAGAGAASVAALRGRLARRPRAIELATWALLLGLLAFALSPSARFLSDLATILEVGPNARVRSTYREALVYRDVARWIAENTPETRGYLGTSLQPEYGILARWDRGHLLRYEAERPVVQDNFAVYGGREPFEDAEDYFAAESEGPALRILEKLGVRYVVADGMGSGQARDRDYGEESMARRLIRARALDDPPDQTMLPLPVPAFRHHRLILETRPGRMRVRHLRVYEVVAGALIEGVATPGTEVLALLQVRSQSRPRPGRYRVSTRASADGSYALRVAYPTGQSDGVTTAENYRVTCREPGGGASRAPLQISEEQVRAGAVLEGPTLDCR